MARFDKCIVFDPAEYVQREGEPGRSDFRSSSWIDFAFETAGKEISCRFVLGVINDDDEGKLRWDAKGALVFVQFNSGYLRTETDDEPLRVGEGQGVFIPPEARHRLVAYLGTKMTIVIVEAYISNNDHTSSDRQTSSPHPTPSPGG